MAQEYTLGTSGNEIERLVQQSRDLEPEAGRLLDRLGIQPGWQVLDVGCGPLGLLEQLSERVGPTGSVVGLDIEPRFVAAAQARITQQGRGNVEVRQADATASGLPPGSFDLVHERLLLIGPLREQIVAEMVALAKPGGLVAVQEIDQQSFLCEPPHPAWDQLLAAFRTFVARVGADLFVGRKLASLLRAAGLQDVEVEVGVRLDGPNEPHRMTLPGLIASIRTPLVGQGIVEEAELTRLLGELQTHLADPTTLVVRELFWQAWGRKAPAA
jgi:SAM-dependent methyltransferase